MNPRDYRTIRARTQVGTGSTETKTPSALTEGVGSNGGNRLARIDAQSGQARNAYFLPAA
jgi:hypothetical protein